MRRETRRALVCLIICVGLGTGIVCLHSSLTAAQDPTLEAPLPVLLDGDEITAAPVAESAEIADEAPADWTAGDYAKLVALKLMPTFVYIVGGLLTLLFGILVVYIRKWTRVELTARQLANLQSIGDLAWKWAQEKAREQMKLPDGKKPDSAQKLEMALDFANGMADELGLKKMAKERLVKLIEAKLLEGRRPEDRETPMISVKARAVEIDDEDTKLDLPGGKKIGGEQ